MKRIICIINIFVMILNICAFSVNASAIMEVVANDDFNKYAINTLYNTVLPDTTNGWDSGFCYDRQCLNPSSYSFKEAGVLTGSNASGQNQTILARKLVNPISMAIDKDYYIKWDMWINGSASGNQVRAELSRTSDGYNNTFFSMWNPGTNPSTSGNMIPYLRNSGVTTSSSITSPAYSASTWYTAIVYINSKASGNDTIYQKIYPRDGAEGVGWDISSVSNTGNIYDVFSVMGSTSSWKIDNVSIESYDQTYTESLEVTISSLVNVPVAYKYNSVQTEVSALPDGIAKQSFSNRLAALNSKIVIDPTVDTYIENADTRQQNFDTRNSNDNIKKLADEFFAGINFDNSSLLNVKTLYDSGNYLGALTEYEKYFVGKVSSSSFDFIDTENDNYVANYILDINTGITADDMLNNYIITSDKLGTQTMINIGTPARVDWANQTDFYNVDSEPVAHMLNINQFYVLLDGYATTKNVVYLNKWQDFVDSLCINSSGVDVRSAVDQGQNSNYLGAITPMLFVSYLRKVNTSIAPSNGLPIDPATFARMLNKITKDYTLSSILYARSNPQNWQGEIARDIGYDGLILSDFKAGAFFVDEAMRAYRNYISHLTLPDMVEMQRDLWYNFVIIEGMAQFNNALKALQPEKATGEWTTFVGDTLTGYYEYLTRVLTSSGQYQIGLRNDLRVRATTLLDSINKYYPEFLTKRPETKNMLYYVLKKTPYTTPTFTTDAFTYGGYYMFRENWTTNAQVGMLFSGRYPQDGFRIQANNIFGLRAFGQDMIRCGERDAYSMVPSPITVDGKVQDAEVGFIGLGHRRMYDSAPIAPPDSLFYTSTSFDFAKTKYDGFYADYNRGTPDVFESVYQSRVSGISHIRDVSFLRDLGFWIIKDDMVTDSNNHSFKQKWYIPTMPLSGGNTMPTGYTAFDRTKISTNATDKTIQTGDTNKPIFKMYQFTDKALSYSMYDEAPATSYYISDYKRIEVDYQGSGTTQLATLIFPYQQGTALPVVTNLTSGSIKGFSATTSVGTAIYKTASTTQELTADVVKINGTSLLLTTKGSTKKGIAIGCSGIWVNNVQASSGNTDFEFTVSGNGITNVKPIFSPVATVDISPKTRAFSTMQLVTMSCSTPNVNIRYTTDGSEPTLTSQLYNGAFYINSSANIKARAFRTVVTQMPITDDNTNISPITSAYFYKQTALPATNVSNISNLQSGLTFEYYEDKWQDLLLDFIVNNSMTPANKGSSSLIDVSARNANRAFGFKYKGYINIPQTGVYTFSPSDEYYRLDVVQGYELALYIDNVKWELDYSKQNKGTFSTYLQQGMHKIEVRYADLRKDSGAVKFDNSTYILNFNKSNNSTIQNFPNFTLSKDVVFSGVAPTIYIESTQLSKRPIDNSMLFSAKQLPEATIFAVDSNQVRVQQFDSNLSVTANGIIKNFNATNQAVTFLIGYYGENNQLNKFDVNEINILPNSQYNINFPFLITNERYVKLMVWQSLSDILPICNAEVLYKK